METKKFENPRFWYFFFRKLKDFSGNPKVASTLRGWWGFLGDMHWRLIYPGDRSASELSQKAEIVEKNALHVTSTLSRPFLHGQAYPQKLFTASPSIPVATMKPSLLSLILQPDKMSVEKSYGNSFFSTISGEKNFLRKVRSESKFASKPTSVHIALSILQWSWCAPSLDTLTALDFR